MADQLFYVAAVPFEAARKVEILPTDHRASRLHGHSFIAKVRTEIQRSSVAFPGAELDYLRDALLSAVAPIDYSLLNDQVPVPTDENLARWVRNRLSVSNASIVGIQSTSEQGVDLAHDDRAHLWRKYRFEAAHQLPNVPEGHQCGRMHGHGFEVILHVDQDIGDSSMGIDFDLIDQFWTPYQEKFHLACLNDIPGLENPTSEMLAGWIWARLKPGVENLSWVTVYETHTSGCHFDGEHYRIWKEQRFESACRLMEGPGNDRRRSLHGHSYLVRLHLTAPLDKVMGWTVDYGDVKELFKPTYSQLDHHILNELPGLDDTDAASLVCWIKEQMADQLPQLDRIDLYETPGCGAVLSWGKNGPALPV